jgi:hypothetical protein
MVKKLESDYKEKKKESEEKEIYQKELENKV